MDQLADKYDLIWWLVSQKVPFRDVDDVVQDVYVRLVRSLKTYRQECSLDTWINCITHNAVSVYYRNKNRATNRNTGLMPDGVLPDDRWVLPVITASIADSLGFLLPSQIPIMILHYWHGLSFKEIAQMTGMAYEAVRTRHRRAIKRCQDNMLTVWQNFGGDYDVDTNWDQGKVVINV